MRSRVVGSLGVSLGLFLFAASIAGQAYAQGADYDFESCAGWVNCSTESPNYTGICCRPCKDRIRGTIWDCKRVGAERERLGTPSAGLPAAGEATITGIVTKEGVLQADKGPGYAVAGVKATELRDNMGKKIEVKGTVQEAEGKVTIDVDTYELLGYGEADTAEASRSCAPWLNCDSRAPTFTGTCCRECPAEKGGKSWDCKVFSVGEHFDLAEWTQ